MQNYQVYVEQLRSVGLTVYRNQYFYQLAVVFTVVLFFFLGRLSYDKKLTHLLQMVNDAQTTRKTLTTRLQKQNKLVQKVQTKKTLIWVLLGLVVIINAGLYYINQTININYILYTVAPFIAITLLYFIIVRLTKWNRNKTQKRLKSTSLTAQIQIKEILRIFGNGLRDRLKVLYQSQIDSQWAKQSKEDCKLYKCYNQKKCYEDLYKLYDEVIDEIKKFNMCDVCLSEENISVQKLGLAELETQIKNFKRARSGKLNIAQKKQIVNLLLSEYQKMNQKLPHICKKGCCIKQRTLIQNAKIKFHDRLKRTQSQLASTERR